MCPKVALPVSLFGPLAVRGELQAFSHDGRINDGLGSKTSVSLSLLLCATDPNRYRAPASPNVACAEPNCETFRLASILPLSTPSSRRAPGS
jgi:hypothetical protein